MLFSENSWNSARLVEINVGYLALNFYSIPTLRQTHFRKLGDTFSKIPNLEDLTLYMQTFYGPKNQYEDQKPVIQKLKKVKKLKLKSGRKTGWYCGLFADKTNLLR